MLTWDSNLKGAAGELDFMGYLEQLQKQYSFKFIYNVSVPSANRTTQIDFILLSTKGFFCFEVKSWYGIVYCSDYPYWYVGYNNGDIKVRNPKLQNLYHVKYLQKQTGSEYFSAVVFPESTELRDRVFGIWRYSDVELVLKSLKDKFSTEIVETEYHKLILLKQANEISRLAQMHDLMESRKPSTTDEFKNGAS